MRELRNNGEGDLRPGDDTDRDTGVAPGKVTLTSKLSGSRVLRKAGGGAGDDDQSQALIDRARGGGGQGLPAHLQGQFESSLGAPLDGVRVHTGPEASDAATALGARAFAVGQDVMFGAGEYDPFSTGGVHLLAHEVAHTVQQAGVSEPAAANKDLEVSEPGDALEREADAAADAMVAGGPAQVSAGSAGTIARAPAAPAAAAAPPTITVPSGKTKVGINEKITFTGSEAGTWKASSGKPTSGDSSTSFDWTAGTVADAAAKITLKVGDKETSQTIQVVAPTGLKFVNAGASVHDNNKAGAGMLLDVFVEPLDVKFAISGMVAIAETDVAATNVTGYFAKHGGDHFHKAFSAAAYVQSGNKLDVQDRAISGAYDPPYEAGSFTWTIPTNYRVFNAENGGPFPFFTSTQTFAMDDQGGVTVTKSGATVTRAAPPPKKSGWFD